MSVRSFVWLALLVGPMTGCGAGAPPYAECVDDLDCPNTCYRLLFTRSDGTEATGQFCSNACEGDADCPEGGACIGLEGDPADSLFCVARCETSADCYVGLACTQLEGAAELERACLP